MNKAKICLVVVIGLAFAATVFASMRSNGERNATAAPAPTDVNVVNKPIVKAEQLGDWKVDINGVTKVDVQGPVKAQQNGAWNVGIIGTPTIKLAPGTTVSVSNLPTGSNSPASHFVLGGRYKLTLVPPQVDVLNCTVRQADGVWIKCELPGVNPINPPPTLWVNANLIMSSDK